MPFCPRDSFLKLSNEMVKINNRLEAIKCMTLKELMAPVEFQYETKQSRVNFIDYLPSLQSIVAPAKIYNINKTKKNEKIMTTPKKKRSPVEKGNPIFDETRKSREKAIELSKTHIDTKPIKYLLK